MTAGLLKLLTLRYLSITQSVKTKRSKTIAKRRKTYLKGRSTNILAKSSKILCKINM